MVIQLPVVSAYNVEQLTTHIFYPEVDVSINSPSKQLAEQILFNIT